jgi:hypothetical protein
MIQFVYYTHQFDGNFFKRTDNMILNNLISQVDLLQSSYLIKWSNPNRACIWIFVIIFLQMAYLNQSLNNYQLTVNLDKEF